MRCARYCRVVVVLLCTTSRGAAQSATAPLFPPPAADSQSRPSEPWTPPTHTTIPIRAPAATDATQSNSGDLSTPPFTAEELPSGAESPAGEIAIEEPAEWYQPAFWIGPEPWDSGIELGLNGSSGSSESMSIRTGGYIKRESRFSKLDFSTYLNRTTTSGETTQDNAQLDVRNDWLLDESSPWTLFGAGNVFYDKFQAFDLQTNVNTGVGYRFVHEPGLDFLGRVGGGTSREFGGPDDRWVPESLLGFEYGQQLSPTQKVYGKLDYYPEWDQIGEYRLVADTGLEIELLQPSNISLKISATDRYDSTSNGANPHLVNYSVLLLLKL